MVTPSSPSACSARSSREWRAALTVSRSLPSWNFSRLKTASRGASRKISRHGEDNRVIWVKLADRITQHTRRWANLSAPSGATLAAKLRDLRTHLTPARMGKVRVELEDLAFQASDPDAIGDCRGDSSYGANRMRSSSTRSEQTVGNPSCVGKGSSLALMACETPIICVPDSSAAERSRDRFYYFRLLRIITRFPEELLCRVGVIHNKWRPIPGRIKISSPFPPHLYHRCTTSVVGPEGQTFIQVQIRTEECIASR